MPESLLDGNHECDSRENNCHFRTFDGVPADFAGEAPMACTLALSGDDIGTVVVALGSARAALEGCAPRPTSAGDIKPGGVHGGAGMGITGNAMFFLRGGSATLGCKCEPSGPRTGRRGCCRNIPAAPTC